MNDRIRADKTNVRENRSQNNRREFLKTAGRGVATLAASGLLVNAAAANAVKQGSSESFVTTLYESLSEKQKKTGEISLKQEQKKYEKEIVTEIVLAKKFYKAEEYHQQYIAKRNPANIIKKILGKRN